MIPMVANPGRTPINNDSKPRSVAVLRPPPSAGMRVRPGPAAELLGVEPRRRTLAVDLGKSLVLATVWASVTPG